MPFARTAGIIQLDAASQHMSRSACAPCDRLALSNLEELFSVEVKVSGSQFCSSFGPSRNRFRRHKGTGFISTARSKQNAISEVHKVLFLVLIGS